MEKRSVFIARQTPVWGFTGGARDKESTCQCRRQEVQVLSLDRERSPGIGNDHPLQYFCLENRMDRGTWWDTVHGVTESET